MTSRRNQRGFVLVAALVLAILYFALMQLVLVDASRALLEAQRFRSRTVAATLAENGAELAAQRLALGGGATVTINDPAYTVTGTARRVGNQFQLEGTASTKEVMPQTATVTVDGRVNADNTIEIDYTTHTQ